MQIVQPLIDLQHICNWNLEKILKFISFIKIRFKCYEHLYYMGFSFSCCILKCIKIVVAKHIFHILLYCLIKKKMKSNKTHPLNNFLNSAAFRGSIIKNTHTI